MANCTPEIAVVGAGAAGYAGALALAREGFRVCLIGAPAVAAPGRTVALFGASTAFLHTLGVWDAVSARAASMDVMRIVDDTGNVFAAPPLTFSAGELGLDSFGCNIPNDDLVAALAEAAAATPCLTILPQSVRNAMLGGARPRLILDDGVELVADLVVGADGARSLIRSRAGIETRSWSYPQTAVTGVFSHQLGHRNMSTELHTRHGPFTLVPLPGKRSSLVWVTAPENAKRVAALAPEELALAVERQAHSMLGAMRAESGCGVIPMRGLAAARYASQGVALVGEAAHVFPPIGAQGLNLGLRDVAALRDCLVAARQQGDGPGLMRSLTRYDRGRRLDVATRSGAIDVLNRSLLSRNPAMDLLRGAGMLALGGLRPLRQIAMREGLAPYLGLPQLMQAWRDNPGLAETPEQMHGGRSAARP